MASTYDEFMKFKSKPCAPPQPNFPIPSPGDVVIWLLDDDILVCLPEVDAGGDPIKFRKPNSECVPMMSLHSNVVYLLDRDNIESYAAPAKPVSVDADGTINWVRE